MREKRDTMIPLDRPLQEPLLSDVTATVIDLAKLAQRAGIVPVDRLRSIAQEMLERIVAACHAQQGAVLLVMPTDGVIERPRQQPEPVKAPRIFALYHMREEDMHVVPATFAPTIRAIEHITAGRSRWLVCWHPLLEGQDRQPLSALLLLGWMEWEDAHAAAMKRGQRMLPFLLDAVASVIGALLQAERLSELEQLAQRTSLETMDLFKAELLATVSHELRSPLASIKGYAATLLRHERRLARDERHQFLLAISEGANRLERIVDRLLEMSQLETEAITLSVAPIDVARLSQEAVNVAEEQLPARLAGRFTFSLLVEDSEGKAARSVPLVMVDPRRVREVLDNLLENALNYSPEGGAITIAVRPALAQWPPERGFAPQQHRGSTYKERGKLRPMLEMCVCDTGIGIASEHLERIFDRFYRVDRRLTREVNGLGLGLAICKRIVELHDGAIWAESLPGGGSVFHVLLPLATSSEGKTF